MFKIAWGRQLTQLLALMHCHSSNHQTTQCPSGTVRHSSMLTPLCRRCVLAVSSLLVPWSLLTVARWLVIAGAATAAVASTTIATLLWVSTSVVAALWPIPRLGVLEGTLARMRIDEDIAILPLVPFRIPRRRERRALRLRRLSVVEHGACGTLKETKRKEDGRKVKGEVQG